MEISFHHKNLDAVTGGNHVRPTSQKDVATASDDVALENSRALTQALHKTPESRAEQVRRAVELVGQPDYPPPETIRKISHLLAIQIHPEG